MPPAPLTELQIVSEGELRATGWALRERLYTALEASGRHALARQVLLDLPSTPNYAPVAAVLARYATLVPSPAEEPPGAAEALQCLHGLLGRGLEPCMLVIDGVCAAWWARVAQGRLQQFGFALTQTDPHPERWHSEAASRVEALAGRLGLPIGTNAVKEPPGRQATPSSMFHCLPRPAPKTGGR